MNHFSPEDSRLRSVADKVASGRRLDREDGLLLYQTYDLLALGRMANYVREQRHGHRVYCREQPEAPQVPAPAGAETAVDALLELRARQDRSPEVVQYDAPWTEGDTGFSHLKNIAVARLLLDNVTHICAHLTPATAKVSQVSLHFGADTLAGADLRELERLVRAAGREPA